MTAEEILNYCLENLDGTVLVESWGEKGIFYNPDHKNLRILIPNSKESFTLPYCVAKYK